MQAQDSCSSLPGSHAICGGHTQFTVDLVTVAMQRLSGLETSDAG